jgi:hypothetical protein
LAYLIANENTGPRYVIAERMGVSEKCITRWVEFLCQLYYLDIGYSRKRETYFIKEGELPTPLLHYDLNYSKKQKKNLVR